MSDGVLRLERVVQRVFANDRITIPAASALRRDRTRVPELLDQMLRRARGDLQVLSDVPEADVRISGDAEERLSVPREECPTRGPFDRHDRS